MRNDKLSNVLSMFGMVAIGALIGAGIALLMAPDSGQKTRDMIREKSLELKDKAVTTADETKQRANQAIDDITSTTKEKVSSIRHRGEEVTDRALEQARKI